MRKHFIPAMSLALALTAAPLLHAEVKKEEKSLVTFSGMLGRMTNLFGGRSAKEGVISTVAVSGDRKMTANDHRGEIIDLREEKIYELDIRRKTFTVTTFEEMRRRMAEMEAKARENAAKEPKADQPQMQGKEMEIDFDVKNTGQTKTINGFDTRQVIVTVTVREKGKTLEESGGLVMTADNWLTRSVPALKEISDFDMRYYQKLAGPQVAVDAQQLAAAMAMMPGLKDAFARMNRENLDGTAIAMTTIESVKSADQMKQQAAAAQSGDSSTPTSVGGAIGGFMRRRQQNAQAADTSPRATFMTMNNEVLKIATSVSAADVAMPAGFKEKK